ncbi:hypothetical protein SADUNF_Sadunf06G0079900 [Salix dunnii]|uniref:Uncharacterized protein n=1 Tax=Salix dunnii TaxID=1413687 RepID=A0A835K3P1_9ROSI|nr:hypothetical protein SADUNF_Sadunf06G0079900 [Salix dunnii]
MAGGNFMHRVLSYVVNELVVNGLANRSLGCGSVVYEYESLMNINDRMMSVHLGDSPAFQRFAVKTSRRIDDISNLAAKKKQELAEQVKDLSKNIDSFKNQQ